MSFSQLVALLPRHDAAAAALHAVNRLASRGAEDAAVAAARMFAHSAAHWSEETLRARTPDLLRRWCGHRDFVVREVRAASTGKGAGRPLEQQGDSPGWPHGTGHVHGVPC
jgi:hypothetical protein